MIAALQGCALQREHTRRNFHFVRYRLMGGPWKSECGVEGAARYCVYQAKKPEDRDPDATLYYFHYATGDEKSLARLGLANALARGYRRAEKRLPRLISISYGEHWLLSDRPGKRQTVATAPFLKETLGAIEQRFGKTSKSFVWGMSMGGHNALEAALAAPERWTAAAVSCPAVYVEDPFAGSSGAVAERTGAPASWVSDGMELFNTRLEGPASWAAEDPVGRAKAGAPVPPMLIQANIKDEFGFLEGARALVAALKAHGRTVELVEESGGHCVNDVSAVGAFFARQ